MKESNKIRFIATNYVNLQGLRFVPMGMCLLLIALWANALWVKGLVGAVLWVNGLVGAVKYFTIPGVIIVSMIVSLLLIDKYYFRNFGQIQRTPESSRFEWLISIVGGIFALGALWVDITLRLPVSFIGLVFATGLIADYLRLTWLVGGRFLIYYPLGAIFAVIVSILPLFGIPKWWLSFGLENELVGISILIGVFFIFAGVWGHLFLLRALYPRLEVNNDHTI
jgi:hypothetical protein